MKNLKIHALILAYITALAGCGKAPETPALSLEDTLSPAETAYAAYMSLLSGDISLFDDRQIAKWGLENWGDYVRSDDLTYEYTYLDLDGDGVDELLFQMENDPRGHNAVFHYSDGRLFCWENDMVESAGCHYPLTDGTMAAQYDYNGKHSYIIFRYLSDGKREELSHLFMYESSINEDNAECRPYYEINGTEVNQTVFEEQMEELITNRMLPRPAWITL